MLKECLRALWRRRVLSALAVVVAVATAGLAFVVVPPTQHSTAQVLFVPSVQQPGVKGPTNPFMSMSGAVAIIASVVQTQASDDRTAARLVAAGHTADYEVTPNLAENAGPILLVDVKDPSVRNSVATRDAVVRRIQADLEDIQAQQGIESDLLVRSVVLTSSPRPLVEHKNQVKIAMVGFVAVLALLIMLILLVERRRITDGERRRPDAALADPEPEQQPEPQPEPKRTPEPVGAPARGSSARGSR